MICIQKHLNTTRILMLIVGLWPYQQSKIVKIQLILFYSIMMSFIVFQLTSFLTTKCTVELVIKVSSCSIFCCILLLLYHSFWINIKTVKYLFEQLQHTFNELKDENEIAIIKIYGNNTKRNAAQLTLLITCVTLIVIFLPILPNILDIILPINESRRHTTQFVTEYFVDEEKYFYFIVLHMNTAICIGTIGVAGIGSMLLGYIKYICGMFSIASYRIEQAMMSNMLTNSTLRKNIMICKKISNAVDIHRKAMEFCDSLISTFKGTFFLLILTAVFGLSLALYGIVAHVDNIPELWLHFTGSMTLFIAIFIAHYAAQEIIDHNNNIFITVYNVNWYMAPLHIQKMILFLLQKGTKPFNITIGSLFVGSLESAATMASASVSYFTVLYSMRQ